MSREAGNAHLKAGRLSDAIESYSAALSTPSLSPSEEAALFANRALALLRLGEHTRAIQDCDSTLRREPRYVKALFRRAQAHRALGELAEAFRDVQTVMQIEPANKEAHVLAKEIKLAIEAKAAAADLSAPRAAVQQLLEAADEAARTQAVGKISRIAAERSNVAALLHAGAVPPLLGLLPEGTVGSVSELPMPLLGLAVEALERIASADVPSKVDEPGSAARASSVEGRRAIGGGASADAKPRDPLHGSVAARLLEVVRVCAGVENAPGGGAVPEDDHLKNYLSTATRGLSLLSLLAACRPAVGSQDAQAAVLRAILPYTHSEKEGKVGGPERGDAKGGRSGPVVPRAALDAILRLSDLDADACRAALPDVIRTLMWLVGDDEKEQHRTALAVFARLLSPPSAMQGGSKDKAEEEAFTKSACSACETVFSPILRGSDTEWEEHIAAVHGVTAVLEVNKAVGAWLLRQESIFWSLAEVADMDDADLQRALAEIYAHAASDVSHFKEKEGEEPIRHLKTLLKSPKPKVRARAAVALAKVCLLHPDHRVSIDPTTKLLSATLGLLEAKVPPAVHRWAVEALMYLTLMPDMKDHLASAGTSFGSLVALSHSVAKEPLLHHAIISAFGALCVPREKSEEQKRLEQEMEPEQIEQMRNLAAGGAGVSAAPCERPDDPAILAKLAKRLCDDDAVLVVAEIVANARSDAAASLFRTAAKVLLAMAETPECRGKIVAQGGFKALLSCTLSEDKATAAAAAWALAKIGVTTNPVSYPRRPGSGPESMVKPLLRLVDNADHELEQFEACMALCNLGTDPELQARIVSCGGWRSLQMALACDNHLVQRAAIEAMSNLVTHNDVVERFTDATSTDVKLFVGFCGSDDSKSQIAASGAIATLAGDEEIGKAFLKAGVLEPLIDIALLSEEPPLLHRAAVALERLFIGNMNEFLGPQGAAPTKAETDAERDGHALVALGALITLSSSSVEPAAVAASSALSHLRKTRPTFQLPPPEAVAAVVRNIREEKAKRDAEAAEEEAKAVADGAVGGKAQDLSISEEPAANGAGVEV